MFMGSSPIEWAELEQHYLPEVTSTSIKDVYSAEDKQIIFEISTPDIFITQVILKTLTTLNVIKFTVETSGSGLRLTIDVPEVEKGSEYSV